MCCLGQDTECEEDPSCTQLLLKWEIPSTSDGSQEVMSKVWDSLGNSKLLTSLPGTHRNPKGNPKLLTSLPGTHRMQEFLLTQGVYLTGKGVVQQ